MTDSYVPAEEEPHERTLMQWPVNRKVYRDRVFLEITQRTIADIANTIGEFEPVVVMAHPDDQANARKWLSSGVEIWDIPTEDLWCRDAGPIFAKNADGLVVSHIQFNGWGEKQVNGRDSQIAAQIARHYAGREIVTLNVDPLGELGGGIHCATQQMPR